MDTQIWQRAGLKFAQKGPGQALRLNTASMTGQQFLCLSIRELLNLSMHSPSFMKKVAAIKDMGINNT
jgi:hypothetical protein